MTGKITTGLAILTPATAARTVTRKGASARTLSGYPPLCGDNVTSHDKYVLKTWWKAIDSRSFYTGGFVSHFIISVGIAWHDPVAAIFVGVWGIGWAVHAWSYRDRAANSP